MHFCFYHHAEAFTNLMPLLHCKVVQILLPASVFYHLMLLLQLWAKPFSYLPLHLNVTTSPSSASWLCGRHSNWGAIP